MFTYNFKRLINLIEIDLFKKLCITVKENDLSQIREEIAAHTLAFIRYMNDFYKVIFYGQYFLRKLGKIDCEIRGGWGLSSQSQGFVRY
ncbi:MAG: hypothetical protein GXP61_01620 [Epsilonproteobacteria bacterium]|nr:hypothetical protein [Campylobacterota bacterium]